ncbi:major histocompatibility complex class I-related gene protein-like [Anarhichas minor]|uniref:major histocompatibility complex class I-related gene protein-like n=1 Tax=Anarhichas minor TaxID=65739 RepID=UPI003F735F0E
MFTNSVPINLLCSAVKHSLKYFLTATSGVTNIPEFVGIGMVDEVKMGYYDSNIKTAEPKQDWVRDFIKDNPQHMELYTQRCFNNQQFFRANLDGLKQRLNQTGGAHILQRMTGCEWDDETGEVIGFHQYGYDGEDFLVLDLQTMTWTAPRQQAFSTKLIWDADKARLEYDKYHYIHTCPHWLKEYLHYGRNFLQRTAEQQDEALLLAGRGAAADGCKVLHLPPTLAQGQRLQGSRIMRSSKMKRFYWLEEKPPLTGAKFSTFHRRWLKAKACREAGSWSVRGASEEPA